MSQSVKAPISFRNGRKQNSGEFHAVTLQSLLSGRELTVYEIKRPPQSWYYVEEG